MDNTLVPLFICSLLGFVAWLIFTSIRRFLMARLEREGEPRTAPFRSILIGVQLSIVLIIFGAALLLLHANHTLPDEPPVVLGTLAIALGVGLGIAAAATYVLSRSFGLVANSPRS